MLNLVLGLVIILSVSVIVILVDSAFSGLPVLR